MNSESRYATAEMMFAPTHTYDAVGQVDLDEDKENPVTVARGTLYRLTTLPLPDPPKRTKRASVVDQMHLYAASEYNDPQKWWLVADANPQIRHPLDLRPNDVIYLP